MKFIITSLVICYFSFGSLIEANIIDDIFMRNWKDKEAKQDDPFFNPFGLTFPLFEPADDPMTAFLKSEADKDPRATRKEARKAKLPKPWFSISEFLTPPETSRKMKSERRKQESGLSGGSTAETVVPNDKITLTGDLAQTKSPPNVEEGKERNKRGLGDQKTETHEILVPNKHIKFDLSVSEKKAADVKNESVTTTKGKIDSKFSFPRGLSDILIIFQKVGPKPKSRQLITSAKNHECDEYCHNGICEMRGPWNRGNELEHEVTMNTEGTPGPTSSEIPHHKKGQLLANYDRICILAIPMALGIGTLLFIFELRRIFKKMKKQSALSTFGHQEC